MLNNFGNTGLWKAIILYGLNSATYKIALGKTLLDLVQDSKGSASWETLSQVFLDNYKQRLQLTSMPQQGNPARLTEVERIIFDLNADKLSYDQAIALIGRNAFGDVIPRFHTIGTDKEFARGVFYDYEFGKKLILKDALFGLEEKGFNSLKEELMARWSLLEAAFEIKKTHSILSNDQRTIYLLNGYERTNLTGHIPFLSAYQGDTCFYCARKMAPHEIQVEHVLPRQVLRHDEIWNLVLACSFCNQRKSDMLVGELYIKKLIARNENVMGSNHPWKGKIESQLGKTDRERCRMLRWHYEQIMEILGFNFWEGDKHYRADTDEFYKLLITNLNNG